MFDVNGLPVTSIVFLTIGGTHGGMVQNAKRKEQSTQYCVSGDGALLTVTPRFMVSCYTLVVYRGLAGECRSGL